MMRALCLCAAFWVCAPVSVTEARPDLEHFGVGLMVGESAGFSAKVFIDADHAIDAGLSFSLIDQRLQIHGDYLLHFAQQSYRLDGGRFVPYVGVGGKLRLRDSKSDRSEDGVAVRLPVGAAFHPDPYPIDIFLELAPAMLILPETRASLGAALGARFYF